MAYADILRSTVAPAMEDVADLIEGIFSSAFGLTWGSWSPSYTPAGSMTFTSTTTNVAKYIQCGKWVCAIINASGTIGGTPSVNIAFSLPVNAVNTFNGYGGGYVSTDGSANVGAIVALNSTTAGVIGVASGSTFGSGSSRKIAGLLIYEAA